MPREQLLPPARITIAGDEATIEDLESKNGTFVTDRRLRPGSRTVIRFGSARFS